MLRASLAVMLAALLVLTGTGSFAAEPKESGVVTLSGRLEYITSLSAPHYEVGGYVLLFPEKNPPEHLVGQDVVVTGSPSTGPSIYMRKTIRVESVQEAGVYSPPAKDDGKVTLPVIPAPQPGDVTVPAAPAAPPKDGALPAKGPEPVPLWGTSHYILFGEVQAEAGGYVLLQETPIGDMRIPIQSKTVDLSALTGLRAGLIVAREPLAEGAMSYAVMEAVVLTADLGDRLEFGPIYLAPPQPIRIMLNGQELSMDQPPILGNSRTLVPLRAIGETIGATVTWNQETRTASVALGDRTVNVTIGTNRVVVTEPGKDAVTIYSDIAPVVAGGRTLVPVRVISEGLGLQVGWDEATRTVTLQ